jgi:hypothetical protein
MSKEAQFSGGNFSGISSGPTLSDLEMRIKTDQALSEWERQQTLNKLQREVGMASPNTPLRELVLKIGGGVLGFLVAKYFKMGVVGQAVAAAAGYGIGKVMNNFYDSSRRSGAGFRFYV